MNKKLTVLSVWVLACLTPSVAQNVDPVKMKAVRMESPNFQDKMQRPELQLKPQTPNVLRSAQAAAYRPDSTVTYFSDGTFSSKTLFSYGNKSETDVTFTWDTLKHNWLNSSRLIYNYDANGKITLRESDVWNTNKNNWIGSSKWVAAYDGKGNNTLWEIYSWDTQQNNWIGTNKYIYGYDKNGNKISWGTDAWDTSQNQWMEDTRTVYDSGSSASAQVRAGIQTRKFSWDGNFAFYRCLYVDAFYFQYDTYWVYVIFGFIEDFDMNDNFQYDSKGKLLNAQISLRESSIKDWWNIESCSATYNSKNLLQELVEENQLNRNKADYTYDSQNRIISVAREYYDKSPDTTHYTKTDLTYDAYGNCTSVANYQLQNNQWTGITKDSWTYDANGNLTAYAYYDQWKNGGWVGNYKYSYEYDANGKQTAETDYQWKNNDWAASAKTIYILDTGGNTSMNQSYQWVGNRWVLSTYTIYYPNTFTSNLEITENQTVNSNNEGSTALGFPIVQNDTITGKMTVQLPNGIKLNIDKTLLAPELAGKLLLVVTPQPDNSWLIEIKLNDLKSAKAVEAYQKILDIAYTVDPALGKGTYEMLIQNLNLELSDGTRYIEESRKVNIQVLRGGTAIESVANAPFHATIANHALKVESPQPEMITIYSAAGVQLYSVMKSAGAIEIPVASLTVGSAYIVKGSISGTIKVVK